MFICISSPISPSTHFVNGKSLFALQHVLANRAILETNNLCANAEIFTIDMAESGRSFTVDLFNEKGQQIFDVEITLVLGFEEIK